MKIAMFDFGPLEYSAALASALSKHCQVDFYTSRYHAERRDINILKTLQGKVGVFVYDSYRYRDPRNIFAYYKLSKSFKGKKYNLIHFQIAGIALSPFWMFLFWGRYKRFPLVLTVHDPFQHYGFSSYRVAAMDIMQKIFVKKAKKIIVHGKTLKKDFMKRYPWKKDEDIIIIPHGNFLIYRDWDRHESKATRNSSVKNILFFGGRRPNKGIEYLIKAEPIISEKIDNYKIIIAGPGEDGGIDQYQKYIINPSRFKWVDEFVPTEDVPKYFNDASIVVLPYITATQTGVIPLAYSFGKPVVATNVGAIPEVVEDGKTGVLIEAKNEKALASAIIRLLSDDDQLRKMGENALQYCKQNLSWASIAKKTINIYSELIDKQK